MTAAPAAKPLDHEIFDDETTIAESGRLADLLALWNSLVRAEIGTVQSFPVYDQEALRQQRWHQRFVVIAAITGSAAVLLAILQLAALVSPQLLGELVIDILANIEYLAAILALISVILGLTVAFNNRWRLLRMKAEQYRFLKFHMLLHARGWLERSAAERREKLQDLLAGLHALDAKDARDWAQGTFSLFDDDPAVIAQADSQLVEDIARYFRVKRIGSQRKYFSDQAHKRHEAERKTWLIPPVCFFLSIVFAFLHFAVEIATHSSHKELPGKGLAEQPQAIPPAKSTESPPRKPNLFMIACLLGAAAFPVLGAAVRTMRTAFEFGRNAMRFDGVARILGEVDRQLAIATLPAVKLELLRESEIVLQQENRSWMRLMIEAEWFG